MKPPDDPGAPRRVGGLPAVEQPTNDPSDGGNVETAVLPDAPTRKRRRGRSGTKQVIEWVLLVGTALAIALIIKTFLFQAFYIPSESMVPTLKTNDRVLVNKLSYKLHKVHRGDIVVFTKPKSETSDIKDLVKRVVGLPNETVEGRGGHIYIDGKLLKEPYLPKGTDPGTFSAQTIPSNSIWVMGDNRAFSRDSRYFGPILKSSIVGRVFVRIWPVTRIGFL
jgi:signal peptidase I